MTDAKWDVRELSPGEWRLLRRLRLDALDDSPQAFLSDHEDVKSWGEQAWRSTFFGARWFVARADEVIGLLRSVRDPAEPSSRHVESIWVVPTHRKRGVFRCMLSAIAERERKTGVTDLKLWVLEDNLDALQVYEQLGFEPTGDRQALPGYTDRFERRLYLPLVAALKR